MWTSQIGWLWRSKIKWQIHPAIVYLVSHVANSIPEFRWRIRGDEVVEHKAVHPSFAVLTEVADVFSFCEVKFEANPQQFIEKAQQKMAEMAKKPVFEDDHERDDYLFLSSIPWVRFTSMQHAMHCPCAG